jgi:hypothetical protein
MASEIFESRIVHGALLIAHRAERRNTREQDVAIADEEQALAMPQDQGMDERT